MVIKNWISLTKILPSIWRRLAPEELKQLFESSATRFPKSSWLLFLPLARVFLSFAQSHFSPYSKIETEIEIRNFKKAWK